MQHNKKILRTLINSIAVFAPLISAKLVYAIWVSVQRSKRPVRENECFEKAAKSDGKLEILVNQKKTQSKSYRNITAYPETGRWAYS